jgi:hypothetical protein
VRLPVARSAASLLVVRLILIANVLTLLAVGALFLLFAERPAGFVIGGVLWLVAVGLVACLPLTDPYRRERSDS